MGSPERHVRSNSLGTPRAMVAANAVFVTLADHPPLVSAVTAMGSAPWWRLSLMRAICISIDMRLGMTEVILEQPAKPPHLVSRLTQQTHHPEQHRNRDCAHQKSHRDRNSIQNSYPQLPLGRLGCRHSLACASFIAQHTGIGCDRITLTQCDAPSGRRGIRHCGPHANSVCGSARGDSAA